MNKNSNGQLLITTKRLLSYVCFILVGCLSHLLYASLTTESYGKLVPIFSITLICLFFLFGMEFFYNENKLCVYVGTFSLWIFALTGIVNYIPIAIYLQRQGVVYKQMAIVLNIISIISGIYVIYILGKILYRRKMERKSLIRKSDWSILSYVLFSYCAIAHLATITVNEDTGTYANMAVAFLIIGTCITLRMTNKRNYFEITVSVQERYTIGILLCVIGLFILLRFGEWSWSILLISIGTMLLFKVSKLVAFAVVFWMWMGMNILLEHYDIVQYRYIFFARWFMLFAILTISSFITVALFRRK